MTLRFPGRPGLEEAARLLEGRRAVVVGHHGQRWTEFLVADIYVVDPDGEYHVVSHEQGAGRLHVEDRTQSPPRQSFLSPEWVGYAQETRVQPAKDLEYRVRALLYQGELEPAPVEQPRGAGAASVLQGRFGAGAKPR